MGNPPHKRDSEVAPFTEGRTLNHVAKVYDLLSPIMTFGQEGRLGKKAIGLLGLSAGSSVLDIGCGTGTLTIEIAARLPRNGNSLVVGLDASPKMIEIARRKAKNLNGIRFDTAIAENLPYEDESFDRALSTFFFHHVNFELKKKVLSQVWRVLKKNGKLAIVDVDIPVNLFGALCAWSGFLLFQQQEIRENIQGKLREAFNLSGFRSWHTWATHLGYISIFILSK